MPNDVPLRLRRLTVWLSVAAALLVALNCLAIAWAAVQTDGEAVLPYVRMLIFDFEGNIPTWFSSALLLYSAILLAILAGDAASTDRPFANHWRLLAALFVCLSLDEAASLHEMVDEPLRTLGTSGILYHAWILPAGAALVALALAYRRFLVALPSGLRRRILIAAALYVGGAIGMEMAGGWWREAHGTLNLVYGAIMTVEETLEIIGLLVFTHALAGEIASRRLRLAPS